MRKIIILYNGWEINSENYISGNNNSIGAIYKLREIKTGRTIIIS